MNIALLTPYLGGDAVYTARALLGIDQDNYNIPFANPPQILKVSTGAKVYPNPAKNEINISFAGIEEVNNSLFEIYTMMGNKLISTAIPAGYGVYILNISRLPAGVYYYRFTVNGSVSESNKLIVVK